MPQSLTAAQLVSSQELTFTVPTDRRAFARESTTEFGPSGESSTGSRRASTLDSAPGGLPSTVSEVEKSQLEEADTQQCVYVLLRPMVLEHACSGAVDVHVLGITAVATLECTSTGLKPNHESAAPDTHKHPFNITQGAACPLHAIPLLTV